MATREEKFWQHYKDEKRQREAGGPAQKPAKTQKVRRKDWTETYLADPDGFDDPQLVSSERIMPKGEIEWRQAKVIRSPLHDGLGAPEGGATIDGLAHAADGGPVQTKGTVVEISSDLCRVRLGQRTLLCTLRQSLRIPHSGYSNMLAVGDAVLVSHNGHERGIIDAILPRRSALARPDPFNTYRQQVIVANVDQLLVVAAWHDPEFWPELVDRYLIAAMRHGLTPIICVNKIDLAEDPEDLARTAAAYRAAGQRVILASAHTGAGLDEVRGVLVGKTTALAGLSGVGKSSLLNGIGLGLNLRIGAVSECYHAGRHTTTQVSLHPLSVGGFVVDTPGIREFGLVGLSQAQLPRFYPEFGSCGPCAYADCSHTREPGCAVKAAVRAGRVSAMRLDSYRKIWHDLSS